MLQHYLYLSYCCLADAADDDAVLSIYANMVDRLIAAEYVALLYLSISISTARAGELGAERKRPACSLKGYAFISIQIMKINCLFKMHTSRVPNGTVDLSSAKEVSPVCFLLSAAHPSE